MSNIPREAPLIVEVPLTTNHKTDEHHALASAAG